MSRLRQAAGCLALLYLVALGAACSAHGNYDSNADGLTLIVTQAPMHPAAVRTFDPDLPGSRYPEGSRVILARPGTAVSQRGLAEDSPAFHARIVVSSSRAGTW